MTQEQVEIEQTPRERLVWLKVRIKDIQLELGSHKISRNEQHRMNIKGAEPTELNIRRKELTQELLSLEKELSTINIEKKGKYENPDYQKNLYTLLEEIFGYDEALKISREALIRTSGGERNRIVLNYGFNENDRQTIKRLSKVSTELKDILVAARKQVDRYIRQNEPEVNKAEYHIKVRELITCMPSEKDIFKIKTT